MDLRAQGLLTEKEYLKKRKEILERSCEGKPSKLIIMCGAYKLSTGAAVAIKSGL